MSCRGGTRRRSDASGKGSPGEYKRKKLTCLSYLY